MSSTVAFLAPAPTAPGAAAPSQGYHARAVGSSAVAETPRFPSAALAYGGAALSVAVVGAAMQRKSAGRKGRTARGAASRVAVPFLPEPEYRTYGDRFLAEADAGFDPLQLSSSTSPFGDGNVAYWNYREAEVKHGRLAMLATLGWVAAESLEPGFAKRFGLPDLLAKGEVAPSVLNGGLSTLPSFFLPAILMVSAWIETAPQRLEARKDGISYQPTLDRMPGEYGFDPLDLEVQVKAASGKDKVWLHNAELKHGRAGMVAITIFVLQEFFLKRPVLTQDEETVDFAVSAVDINIDALDSATGLKIPDIPLPFPGA